MMQRCKLDLARYLAKLTRRTLLFLAIAGRVVPHFGDGPRRVFDTDCGYAF